MTTMSLFLVAVVTGMTLLEDKQRPVNRVITLLKDMQKQLEQEAKEDQDVYDKLSCWCNTNGKEKDQAVEIAEQRITQLTSSIEELSAHSAELRADIKTTKEDVAVNQRSLDAATALRRKESAAFTAEEKDAIQSVGALEGAIIILSKHNALSQESLATVQRIVDMYSHRHGVTLLDFMAPSQKRMLTGFLQQPGTVQSYDNQSGEIFGILKQMLVNFKDNLSDSQKEEKAAQETFSQLRAAKEDEIRAGKERVGSKTSELADTNEKLADAKQDLEDTTNALSSDQKFLRDLRKRCKSADEEFAERTKTRHDEIVAVGEAIKILTNDEAHETLGRSLGFLQKDQKRRMAAARLLRAASRKNPELAALAVSVRLDAFTKVKAAIDSMIVQLKKEKEDEVAHKDWCNTEFNGNERLTTKADRNKDNLQSQIADLTQQIATLKSDIGALHAEIVEMHVQTKRASENRAAENKEFQHTIVDQRATQEILKKALTRLREFYAKKAAELVEVKADPVPGAAAPAAPEGFKAYKKNQAAGGVVGMIQEIINDSKEVVAEATKAEQDAQTGYEEFIRETNTGVAERMRDITNKTASKARAAQDKAAADSSLKGTLRELERLSSYNGELHKSCDFVLKNFDVRQTGRDQEVEALQQAKAILSGADSE
eukprot:GEMP01033768.1.p1 GENE.GEMP01033768.1~~GEMP01033768.1.p1  ORF type:complete len:658 (+),score=230.93 GEMP01033768.1:78-2051(+)